MLSGSSSGVQNRQPRLSTSSQPVLSHQFTSKPVQTHPPSIGYAQEAHTLSGTGEGDSHYQHPRYSVGSTSGNGQVYAQSSGSRVNIGWKDTSVNEANAMTQARGQAANLKPVSRSIAITTTTTSAVAGSSKYLGPPTKPVNRNGRATESEYESDATTGGGRKVTEHVGGSGSGSGSGTSNAKNGLPLKGKGRDVASGSRAGGNDEHESDAGDDDVSNNGRESSQVPPPRKQRGRTPIQALADMAGRTTGFYAFSRRGEDPSRSSPNMGADESFQESSEQGKEGSFGRDAEVFVRGGSRARGSRDFDESSVFSREDSSYQFETNFVEEAKRALMNQRQREGSAAGSVGSAKGPRANKRSPTKHGQSGSISGRRVSGKGSFKDRGYRPGDDVPFVQEDDERSSADEDAGEGIAAHKAARDNAGRRIQPKGPGYLGDELAFDPNHRASQRRSSRAVDSHGRAIYDEDRSGQQGDRINYDERSGEEDNDGDDQDPSYSAENDGQPKKVRGSPQKKAANQRTSKPGPRNSSNTRKHKAGKDDDKMEGSHSGEEQNNTLDFGADAHQDLQSDGLAASNRSWALIQALLSAPFVLAAKMFSDFIINPMRIITDRTADLWHAILNGRVPGWMAVSVALVFGGLWFSHISSSVASEGAPIDEWKPVGGTDRVKDRGWSQPHAPLDTDRQEIDGSSEILDNLVKRLNQMEKALDLVGTENKALKASQRGLEVRVDAHQANEMEASRNTDEGNQREFQSLKLDAADLRAQIGELSRSVQKVGADATRYRSGIEDRLDAHSKEVNAVKVKMALLETQVRESLTVDKWISVLERVLPNVVPVRMHRDTGHVEIDPKLWLEMKRVLTTKTDVESIVRKAVAAATLSSDRQEVITKTPSWRDFLEENEYELQDWADQLFERKFKGAMLLGRDHFLDILKKELDSLRAEVQGKADDEAAEVRAAIASASSARSHQKSSSQAPASSVVITSEEGHNITGVFENLIDAAILRYSKDTIARADFALTTAGAQVIKSQTTPSIELESVSRFGWAAWGAKKITGRDAAFALHPENAPGMCWAFKGNKGQLGIMMSRVVVVSDVTVEHAPAELISAASLQTAPKDIQVWATLEDKEDLVKYRDYILENEQAREIAQIYDADKPTPHHILLGTLTYDPYLNSAPSHVQTFPVNRDLYAMGLKTQSVMFKITDNWGSADEYTCLYRVRVHGDAVEDEELVL